MNKKKNVFKFILHLKYDMTLKKNTNTSIINLSPIADMKINKKNKLLMTNSTRFPSQQ